MQAESASCSPPAHLRLLQRRLDVDDGHRHAARLHRAHARGRCGSRDGSEEEEEEEAS